MAAITTRSTAGTGATVKNAPLTNTEIDTNFININTELASAVTLTGSQALTNKTYNGLTLTANATGFQVAGGTTSKTLVINNNLTLSGTDGSTLRIGTGGITTDANGNLGVSATPSAWDNTAYNAIELNAGALAAYNYTGTTLDLVQNAYYGVGAYTYKTTGAATIYRQQSGKHFWGIASSGTAGTSASFSYPMRLDNLGNLTFSGTGLRIIGDFSNGTFANQLAFQTSTTDGNTTVNIIPNGTGIASSLYVWGNQSMSNTALGALSVANGSSVTLASSKVGTGTALPIIFSIDGNERVRIATSGNVGIGVAPSAWGASNKVLQLLNASLFSGGGVNDLYLSTNAYYGTNWTYINTGAASYYSQLLGVHSWHIAPSGTAGNTISFTQAMTLDASANLTLLAGSLREKQTAIAASDINLNLGNYFSRTISGATTLTVSNIPTSGTAASFILDLTNGGSATITWWTGVKWAGGTAPTLTASGRDVLGFFTYNGGTTWTGLLLGKDVK